MTEELPRIMIKRCSCVSDYQDKRYGKDKRLHNLAVKVRKYRCTVCRTLRD